MSSWTAEEARRAMIYGYCLVCGMPHDMRRIEEDGNVRVELVKPCGHTEEEVDAELVRRGKVRRA